MPKLESENDIAVMLTVHANSYSLSGQSRRVVPLFEMHNELRKKNNDKKNLAIGLGNLALGQIRIGDLESAESNLRRRIEIAKEIEVRKDQPHMELGKILTYCGNFKRSNKNLSKAEEFNKGPQSLSVTYAYRSLRALLMDDSKEALRCAKKALEFAKKYAEESYPIARDFIYASWLIGASYIVLNEPEKAEESLQFAITECRKINLVENEADILLSIAKLRHLQKRDEESLKLAEEALEIANRCGYVLKQADIHLFLAEYYKDAGGIPNAREQAEFAKLRSHQMIDVETGDYITKPENTKYKYKPCYDKAVKFLQELETS